jgi:hypothetical protein
MMLSWLICGFPRRTDERRTNTAGLVWNDEAQSSRFAGLGVVLNNA